MAIVVELEDAPHAVAVSRSEEVADPIRDAGPCDELTAGGCARPGPFARLHVHGPEPGLTPARCPGCAHIALRLEGDGAHIRLTVGGAPVCSRFAESGRSSAASEHAAVRVGEASERCCP